jgi:hypothetical protein
MSDIPLEAIVAVWLFGVLVGFVVGQMRPPK